MNQRNVALPAPDQLSEVQFDPPIAGHANSIDAMNAE
jgi:hypothetical protein